MIDKRLQRTVWNFCRWVAQTFLRAKRPQQRKARRNGCFRRLPPMICSPLHAKQYFPRQRRPAFTDWEARGRLCFLGWSTIMPPLRVEFKYMVGGQGIITSNRDWWEGVWSVWGRDNSPQKSSKVLSEPKFGPPYQKFWIRLWEIITIFYSFADFSIRLI